MNEGKRKEGRKVGRKEGRKEKPPTKELFPYNKNKHKDTEEL